MKKIDIHIHVTGYPRDLQPPIYGTQNKYWPRTEEIIPMLDEAGIEKAVILPLSSPEGRDLLITTEDAAISAREHPDRFFWFCNPDPRMVTNSEKTDFSYYLDFYKKCGAKGVGEVTANLYADSTLMDNFFFHCAETDMPVLIHISPAPGVGYGIVDDRGLYRIEKMLKKYPRLKIIGHSQPFWSEISADNTEATRNSYPTGKVIEGRLHKLLRDYENLYCDLSAGSGLNAMIRDEDHALRFLDEFQDKVMFATDICSAQNTHHLSISRFYDRLRNENRISENSYRKICRENAIRILKLDIAGQEKP
jgi:predicted TIM-barrel fold metal-dependent hydrolase